MSMKESALFKAYRKTSHARSKEEGQGCEETNTNDTLNAFDSGETRTPTLVVEKSFRVYDWHRQNTRMTELGDVCVTATAAWGGGGNNMPYVMEESMDAVVRRLTPLECERLQGYPDNWTDIGEWVDSKGKTRKPADTPRYKALGNSIALPQWQWIIDRMAAYLPEDATLGSLFDGIGGFPLCWERTHSKGTARWASEIEEFPMAVTKIRFAEDNEEGDTNNDT